MSFVEEIQSVAGSCKCVNVLLWCVFGFGVLKLTTLILRTLAMMFDLFILPSVNYSKYGAGKGNYCVVTGASDGIGKEYARQMAQRGFNLILISRTLSKLESIKTQFEGQYKIKVEVLAMDISADESSNYEQIKNLCQNLPITVLINNVGQSHSIPVPFLETKEDELRNIITINNTATLLITQIIAPIIKDTVKDKKSSRGLILTMGSFGGLIPTPLLATYSGSKAFLQNWSTALAGELSGDKIDVELVLSYLVTSAMSKIRRTSMMIPNPKQFVSATLKSVGRRCGAQERYATVTPFWSHAVYEFVIDETFGVYSKIVNTINHSFHRSIRIRALKKAARKANK
ncbi:similar to Saccharomyces cerevisiae YBR159W IFA38 Microsomal beta-keto-reductase [Maudiozyma barnettii]|uniref:Very-long-chain 3-oxoacyl-CoA reductase n=1 Tax=Maudiozyma barnettii TaxID=61262 RepID=A0A8H2VGC6_9SACH|nr:ketoreductase [Kazachstania barnettii]CAB4255065.1 similar to Saccharomyces cerevisiae YBR159W IFA38 Microsomal beta-keto-reductase [Kazachstania barnettii]CAD1783336.1 similar to Saccharomyces cerevisiae YBR159W IFA38 Microsomal beta-keto-reductase [Kazachstania barnettii]